MGSARSDAKDDAASRDAGPKAPPEARADDGVICPVHGSATVPSLGIIVSTIGRTGPLRRLLSSLENQTCRHYVVSVCAQGDVAGVAALVAEYRGVLGAGAYVTTSARGLSRGRNAAERMIAEDIDFLLFPNDRSAYPPTLVEEVVSAMGSATAGGLRVIDEHGDRLQLPASGRGLDRRTVWSVISPGLVIGRPSFRALGGFDESLGSGADTPWQSAEETDLLLRYLSGATTGDFVWLRHVAVETASDAEGLAGPERRAKLRAYARGYGRVLAAHRYGPRWYVRAVVAGLVFGLRRPDQYGIADGMWVALGRVEGLLGRTVNRGPVAAVTR